MAITTFYRDTMSVQNNKSFSPSAGKPEAFIKAVNPKDIELRNFPPATVSELCLAHSAEYIEGILSGSLANGFGNNSKAVASACTYTVGSMVAAAQFAAKTGEIVCSPTSGFHHAGVHYGGGFCTFNGLAVAALKITAADKDARVAILDCDYHYGNGTDDILGKRGNSRILHFTSGRHFHYGDSSADFFDWLEAALEAINDFGATVLIYQAGGDMHIDDPLGGLLCEGELIKRDHLVFNRFKGGIAWNLAGGYQRDAGGRIDSVIKLHLNTLDEANRAAKGRQGAAAA